MERNNKTEERTARYFPFGYTYTSSKLGPFGKKTENNLLFQCFLNFILTPLRLERLTRNHPEIAHRDKNPPNIAHSGFCLSKIVDIDQNPVAESNILHMLMKKKLQSGIARPLLFQLNQVFVAFELN